MAKAQSHRSTHGPRRQVRMTLGYDGRQFMGWQRKPGQRSVQGELEAQLSQLFGAAVEVRGAGRTDRGAHARGQVGSVFLPDAWVGGAGRVAAELPGLLPPDLQLVSADDVPPDFHPREHALEKCYRYEIIQGRALKHDEVGRVWHLSRAVDVGRMADVLPAFVGRHDFTSFATSSNYTRSSSVRDLRSFDASSEGARISLVLRADGFLYKMVRNLVKAVVRAGEGKIDRAGLERALAARDRASAPGTAPASGLYLDRVLYADTPGETRGAAHD